MAGDIRGLTGMPNVGVGQFERGAVPGQPTYIRTWGIPTGPGWRIGPGKWNFISLPITRRGLGSIFRRALVWAVTFVH